MDCFVVLQAELLAMTACVKLSRIVSLRGANEVSEFILNLFQGGNPKNEVVCFIPMIMDFV